MKIHWIIFKLLDKSTDHATETEMIREIKERGHDIRLSCGWRDRRIYYGMDDATIDYFDLPRVRKIRGVFYAAAVWRAVLAALLVEKPDVLLIDYLVNLITAPILLLHRSFRSKTKIIVDVRTLPVDVRYFEWTVRWFFASLYVARLHGDGVTFITEAMRRYCGDHVDMGRLRIGIWTSGFKPAIFDPDRYKKAPAIDAFRLFYHGGLSLSRGIGSLIRATKLLQDRGLPVSLTLIGNCVDRDAFLELIEAYGLQETCRILAPVPYEEVPPLIMDCDLPVIPFPDFIGWRVSSPIKLIEYMAMGKAMVVTDIAAHRDVLGDADFVFYSRSSRPESLADAIDRAYRRREDLEMLGQGARPIAQKAYTWARQAERLLGFLQSVSR